MADGGGEGGAQAFGDVDDRVDEDADLEPLNAAERCPWVVDAA